MANYDEVVKRNKDYLTQAQINALAAASKEYNIANAGNRAGALASAREQYDTAYRGLQNMGLAGNPNAAPASGEVPRLQMQVKTPFESYNERLKQVENQRLGALGEQFKQDTIAQRQAEEAARAAQAEAMRRAQLQAAAQTLQSTAFKVGTTVMQGFANKVMGISSTKKENPAVANATKAQIDGVKRTQQVQQQTVNAAVKAQIDGMNRTARPQDVAAAAAFNIAHYSQQPAVTAANAAQERGMKLTEQYKGAADTSKANQYYVDANQKAFTKEQAEVEYKEAQNNLTNLQQKRHGGGAVSEDEYKAAVYQRDAAKLKAENPKLYQSFAIIENPYADAKSREEAGNEIMRAYGYTNDERTAEQYTADKKKAAQYSSYLATFDDKNASAEEKKAAENMLKNMGVTPDQAREFISKHRQARAGQGEYAYYKNAIINSLTYAGKTPSRGVNKDETDPLYRAVNKLPDITEEGNNYLMEGLPRADVTTSEEYVGNELRYLTEDERNAYNYIYETEGLAAANQYIRDGLPLRNVRAAIDDEAYAKQLVENFPVAANFLSIAAGTVGNVPAMIEKLVKGTYNFVAQPQTPLFIDTNDDRLANMSNLIQSATSQKILESNPGTSGKIYNFAYQTGMSMAQSAVAMTFAAAGAPWAVDVMFFSSAGNEAYKDAIERGATQEQALAYGVLSGTAEALFEHASIEHFMNLDYQGKGRVIRNMLSQAGAEASEEVNTELANILADAWTMRDKSQYNQAVQKYMSNGETEEQAQNHAFLDQLKNVGMAGLGGLVSGLGFGVFGALPNAVSQVKTGKEAKASKVVDQYVRNAALLGGDAQRLAQEVNDAYGVKKTKSGSIETEKVAGREKMKTTEPSNRLVGALVQQVNKQVQELAQSAESGAAVQTLLTGEKLTTNGAKAVMDQLGADTVKEMGYDTSSPSAFAKSFNARLQENSITPRMQEVGKYRQAAYGMAERRNSPIEYQEKYRAFTAEDRANAAVTAARANATNRVWANPTQGMAMATPDGTKVTPMPGNMRAVEQAEQERTNFKARSTATKGNVTYAVAGMQAREGLSNEQTYSEIQKGLTKEARQKAQLYEKLASALGVKMVIHDVMTGTNGFIDEKGNMHVVLSGKQSVLRVAAHELTHLMKENAGNEYASMRDHLISEVGQEKFDRMTKQKANEYGIDLSTEKGKILADDEVCAELCERMLSNEDALEKFAEKDTAAAKTLKEHLLKILNAIKAAFKRAENRDFGESWSDLIKSQDTIESWITGLQKAIDNSGRAVGADEIKTVILPAGKYSNLEADLAKRGVPVVTYEYGNDADRLRALQSAEVSQYLFSLDTDAIRQAFTVIDTAGIEDGLEALKDVKHVGSFALKDITRFLDASAGKNKDLRNTLHAIFEAPHSEATGRYAQGVERMQRKVLDIGKRAGVCDEKGKHFDSKKSAAIQNIGEGFSNTYTDLKLKVKDADHVTVKAYEPGTDKLVDSEKDYTLKELRQAYGTNAADYVWSRVFDETQKAQETGGKPGWVDEKVNTRPYTIDDLQTAYPNDWQKLKAAADEFRQMYDEYIRDQNNMLATIYPIESEYADVEKLDAGIEKKQERLAQHKAAVETQIENLQKSLEAKEKEIASKKRTDTNAYRQLVEQANKLTAKIAEVKAEIAEYEANAKDELMKMNVLKAEMQNAVQKGDYSLKRMHRLQYRSDYFHHFTEMASGIQNLKSIFTNNTDIAPAIVGKSENTKAKTKWAGYFQQRMGGDYTADALNGMLRYGQLAEYKLAFDPLTAYLRDVNKQIRNMSSDTNRDGLIRYIDQWADTIAGKSHKLDRVVSDAGMAPRKAMQVLQWINSRVIQNTLLFNMRSALVQISNITNAKGIVKNNIDWVNGLKAWALAAKGDEAMASIMAQSNFLASRYMDGLALTDSKLKSAKQFAGWMLGALDEVSAKATWWAAYQQYTRNPNAAKNQYRNYDSAVDYADDITRRTHAGRGVGELAPAMTSRVINFVAPFQVEVNNTWQLLKDNVKQKNYLGLLSTGLSVFLFNAAFEAIVGSTPLGFDFIRAVIDIALGFLNDDPDDDPDAKEIAQRFAGELVGGLPFASQLVAAFGEDNAKKVLGENNDATRYGNTQIGVSAVVNAVKGLKDIGTGLIQGRRVNWLDDLDDLMNLTLPMGAKQLTRTAQGLATVAKGYGGKYDKEGNEKVQFVTDQDVLHYIHAGLFGKWALTEASEYFGEKRLLPELFGAYNGKKSSIGTMVDAKEYKAALDTGIDGKDYFTLKYDLKSYTTQAGKRAEMMQQSFTPEQKAQLDALLFAGKDDVMKTDGALVYKQGSDGEWDLKADYTDRDMFDLSTLGTKIYDTTKGLIRDGFKKDSALTAAHVWDDLKDTPDEIEGVDDRKLAFRNMLMDSTAYTVQEKEQLDKAFCAGKNTADYSDKELYDLSINNRGLYEKAKAAKEKGIPVKQYVSLNEKKNAYTGEDKADYLRREVMNTNLTAKQKEALDDILISDKDRYIDYSTKAWFEISMLGKGQYTEAKEGTKVGLKPETYLTVYKKWKTLDAKDENGNTRNGLKKKRAKEYLDSLSLSGPEYSYIWTAVFGYK